MIISIFIKHIILKDYMFYKVNRECHKNNFVIFLTPYQIKIDI